MSIGERISQLRQHSGLSQGDLASLLDVSRQAVSKWENDQSSPDTIRLIRLADVLNTEVEYLATGNHPKYESPPVVVNLLVKRGENLRNTPVQVVEKPVIRYRTRTRFIRRPLEYVIVGAAALLVGILIGLLL